MERRVLPGFVKETGDKELSVLYHNNNGWCLS